MCWQGKENFEFIRHDVTDSIKLEIDQIYHLACPASPVHYKYNPIKTTKTSFLGTLNMLGLAKRTGARFLLTSTSYVPRCAWPSHHPHVASLRANCVFCAERCTEIPCSILKLKSTGATLTRLVGSYNNYPLHALACLLNSPVLIFCPCR